MKTKLAIFDMDGLLINSEELNLVATNILNESLGVDMTNIDMTKLFGSNVVEGVGFFKKLFGPDFDFDDYWEKKEVILDEYIKDHPMVAKKGAFELIHYLKEHGIDIAVGTSNMQKTAMKRLKITGLDKEFEHIFTGESCKRGKPHPDMFLNIVNAFGYKPEECVVFEDSYNGLMCAYNGNIKCILVPDIAPVPEEEKSKAFRVLNNLGQAIELFEKDIL